MNDLLHLLRTEFHVDFAVILAGVLHFTSATVGGRVREFHERRTYNEVKLAAHRAIPVTALLGVVGAGLVFLGAKLRGTRRPTEPSA